MKIALAAVVTLAVMSVMSSGCAVSTAPHAPSANVPVSATTLSSATLTLSSLAPAAWDEEGTMTPAAAVAAPTWGDTSRASTTAAGEPAR